jgi:hypothetical protein
MYIFVSLEGRQSFASIMSCVLCFDNLFDGIVSSILLGRIVPFDLKPPSMNKASLEWTNIIQSTRVKCFWICWSLTKYCLPKNIITEHCKQLISKLKQQVGV